MITKMYIRTVLFTNICYFLLINIKYQFLNTLEKPLKNPIKIYYLILLPLLSSSIANLKFNDLSLECPIFVMVVCTYDIYQYG